MSTALAEPTTERQEAAPEQLALPTIDRKEADRIEVQVGGGVRLDRSDPADCALMRRLALGEEVTLKVVGIVAQKTGKIAWDEDGYPGEVTQVAKLRVTSLYRPVGDGTEARTGVAQLDLSGTREGDES